MSMSQAPTAFTGTAQDYLRYRPPYPATFLAELRALAGTCGDGTLLDLACGPGRVAIPMAPHFRNVLAIDVEAEMIAAGMAEATRRGVVNMAWRVARAEDLQLPSGSIELITIGDAFHRLDQAEVVKSAVGWLQPRGALVTLGTEMAWRGDEAWQHALVRVVNKWTGNALGNPNEGRWGGPVDALRAAGLQVHERESIIDWTWTCDSIIGLMHSTSIASRRRLADQASAFAAELRETLRACAPDDRLVCRQRFSFTLGMTVERDG